MCTADNPVGILYKSIAGRYRPVRVADGPITACYRFIKNASWEGKDVCGLQQQAIFCNLHVFISKLTLLLLMIFWHSTSLICVLSSLSLL